jgi:hypothetical protein
MIVPGVAAGTADAAPPHKFLAGGIRDNSHQNGKGIPGAGGCLAGYIDGIFKDERIIRGQSLSYK